MSSFYYRLAAASAGLSLLSLLSLTLLIPHLLSRAANERYDAELRATKFKEQTDSIWNELMNLAGQRLDKVQFFSRNKRSGMALIGGNSFCMGCMALACPTGPPGAPGAAGPDGKPGDMGNQGDAGKDGFDVQLESEQELPCVVCPGGPQGPRGGQGERGRQGGKGSPGYTGPDGFYGKDGPRGKTGPKGEKGATGTEGLQGEPGDQSVSGMGVKGPKGPPGPKGPQGRPGPRGKVTYMPGEPGPQGPPGEPGENGREGEFGQEGMTGPPGEPGSPSSYCPSDCGVQHITAEGGPSSGMLGEKMTGYEEAMAVKSNLMPDYNKFMRRRRLHDFIEKAQPSKIEMTNRKIIHLDEE